MSETEKPLPKFVAHQKVRCIRGQGGLLEHGKVYEILALALCVDRGKGKECGLIVKRHDVITMPQELFVWDTDRFESLDISTTAK